MLSLTGCFSPVKIKPEETYMLKSVPDVAVRRTRPVTILVMPPEAVPVYNTTQMAYSVLPYQVAYYSHNRWAETPPKMLQPLIVQSLQNSHYFRNVGIPSFVVGQYDYVLNTQLLELQQDYTHRPPLLRLRMRAQLSRAMTNRVIATKNFAVFVPLRQYTPYGGVIAANRATEEMLAQLTQFAINRT